MSLLGVVGDRSWKVKRECIQENFAEAAYCGCGWDWHPVALAEVGTRL